MTKGYTQETIEKYKIELIEYLKKNPSATCLQIRRDTKIKVERLYKGGLGEAYRDAGIPLAGYLLRRNREEQIRDILEFIKSNPGCTVSHIQDVTGIALPRVLGTIRNAYEMAGEVYPKRGLPTAANSAIRKRAYAFEDHVISLLHKRGEVIKYYRTANGVADALLKVGPKIYIIEVKDYRSKNNITLSEIKQLNKYIEGTKNCCDGIVVTHPESLGKRSKVYIDGNEISILPYDELWFRGP